MERHVKSIVCEYLDRPDSARFKLFQRIPNGLSLTDRITQFQQGDVQLVAYMGFVFYESDKGLWESKIYMVSFLRKGLRLNRNHAFVHFAPYDQDNVRMHEWERSNE